jgi:hypothetical protein
MSSESTIQREIRVRMSQLKCILLRYMVGTFISPQGAVVHIGEKGVSDLIGIVPHVVTQEDVGRTVGIFCAMECKRTKGGRLSAEQGPFLKRVNELGGLGAVVRSAEDAESVVREKWDSELVNKFV